MISTELDRSSEQNEPGIVFRYTVYWIKLFCETSEFQHFQQNFFSLFLQFIVTTLSAILTDEIVCITSSTTCTVDVTYKRSFLMTIKTCMSSIQNLLILIFWWLIRFNWFGADVAFRLEYLLQTALYPALPQAFNFLRFLYQGRYIKEVGLMSIIRK